MRNENYWAVYDYLYYDLYAYVMVTYWSFGVVNVDQFLIGKSLSK
jgi:hypothetical protein